MSLRPSVFERNWPTQVFSPISVAAVTGIVTVPSTQYLKVNQDVEIRIAGQPVLKLTVREVLDETSLRLGPLESPFKADPTLPAQLLPYSGGTMTVQEQERSPIQPSVIDRAVYEEAPTVALRTIPVDWLGRFYSVDNPVPVQLSDGSINIGTVNAELEVQLSHQDNVPDPGDVADSVRIGDGFNEAKVDAKNKSFSTNRYEKLLGLLANANWMVLADFDEVVPSFAGDVATLLYKQTGATIGKAEFRFATDYDWDLKLTTYINDDDGSFLLDDDGSELNLD